MSFEKCTQSYSYTHSEDTEQYHHSPDALWLSLCSEAMPGFSTLATTDLLSAMLVLFFPECYTYMELYCALPFESRVFSLTYVLEVHLYYFMYQ